MKSAKRIFVYTEAAPVHRDVVAIGLHRAGPPILRAIRDCIDGIAICPIYRWHKDNELDSQLAPLCSKLSRFPTFLCKALHRYPSVGLGIADVLPPLMLAGRVRRSEADILFSFVGADPGVLTRSIRLANWTGKSCVFYVVDDFLAALSITGANTKTLQREREKARAALSAAKHVFAITDVLSERLHTEYGISPTTLGLAFEPEPKLPTPPKKQIIYLGSINFLYAQGLRDLFNAVQRIRHNVEPDLTVRLTVPPEVATRELGMALPSFVASSPIESSQALAREIASSLFAFLPYSFNPREEMMVATSFPSKSLEYFAYARSIVVYGPEYGVTTRIFRKAGLPSVASSLSELEGMVRLHLATWPEHSILYRKHLAESHSLAAARSIICASLGLTELNTLQVEEPDCCSGA